MKTISAIFIIFLLFLVLPLMQSPIVWFSVGDWLSDISWVGLELLGVVAVVGVVLALLAFISVGVIGTVLLAILAAILFMLFNSLVIALPLLLILIVYWLVSDSKSAST
ncbi:hypothetical protein ACFOEE_13780 [Pseudoalteromonas fenneropenaei]|uniref:Uncharacterized protein n=1 Tax=Pseudoalteromonas fenneropenaei TaxID=1737459 RepID=A0ABV7CM69_9GAMM